MESLYKGSASLGRFTAGLRFYISIGIAVIMVAIAIYLFTRPEVKTAKVEDYSIPVIREVLSKNPNDTGPVATKLKEYLDVVDKTTLQKFRAH